MARIDAVAAGLPSADGPAALRDAVARIDTGVAGAAELLRKALDEGGGAGRIEAACRLLAALGGAIDELDAYVERSLALFATVTDAVADAAGADRG